MSIYDRITDGDTTIAVVYRLVDPDGRIWRSSPYILRDCLYWNADSTGFSNTNNKIRIPTLRHLMRGTVAQIELYIGNVDLQLFQVYANDPTVHYITVEPKLVNGGVWAGSPAGFYTIEAAVNYVGVGETLYTTGGALENAPPPIARCAYSWRNRVFVANGNDIYPSQEFAEGLGLQWNEQNLHMKWEDGTGDILALAHVDWNYLAVFKRDAIGIISGPGPDGMGQGNYIVQTLSTKAGCTNVKSIINGADGLYYQDSQTGRLMLLTPNLQTQECAPGAFDYSSCTITCAAHIEQQRQLWFYAQGAQSRLIVIDYKHRTESSPFGSVYTWWIPWTVSAMYVSLGGPVLVVNDGSTCAQVAAQYSDNPADDDPASIAMDMITGDMNPIGLQRQFHLPRVQFLGDYGSSHRIELDVMPDFAVRTSTHVIAIDAGPEQGCARPANCMRIQSVRLRVRELINTTGTPPVPVIGPGFKFIGFALEIQDCGKVANLSTTRIA